MSFGARNRFLKFHFHSNLKVKCHIDLWQMKREHTMKFLSMLIILSIPFMSTASLNARFDQVDLDLTEWSVNHNKKACVILYILLLTSSFT